MAALPPPPTPTLSAIYAAYEADRGDGFRDHLGASLIGKTCERALWFDFRWVTPAQFPGRILRLFETGQLEEARLVRNLRATGATVLDRRSRDRPAVAGRGAWRAFRRLARCGRDRAQGSAEDLARGRVQDPFGQELPRARSQGRRAVEAAALGADADLHASDRHHPGAVCGGVQGHRRSAHRAGARRRRGRRPPARESAPGHRSQASAGAHLGRSRLVGMPVLQPPRRLP